MTTASALTSNDVFTGYGAGDRLYNRLHRALKDAGCFEPVRARQVGYMVLVASAFGLGYLVLLSDAALWPRLAALVLIAAANVHAGFVAHEIGHGAFTRNRKLAMAVGQFFLTFLTALTYGHFQDIHSRHHAHTNRHDRTRTCNRARSACIFNRRLRNAARAGW